MLHSVLTATDLSTLTGYARPADVERCLQKQGVRFFWGKDGPWTTIDLVNAAGGLRQSGNDETYAEPIL